MAVRDDWLERQAAALAAAIARVLGAKTEAEAEAEVRSAAGLGLDLAERLDATSVAAMLGADGAKDKLLLLAAGLERLARDADPGRSARLLAKAEALRVLAQNR